MTFDWGTGAGGGAGSSLVVGCTRVGSALPPVQEDIPQRYLYNIYLTFPNIR